MTKKYTLTIAISAYNEANNISPLVSGLIAQESKYYVLKNLVISSDGSSDDTVKLLRRLESKVVKVNDYKRRMGKAFRLAEIYKKINTDLVIVLDADLILPNNKVIDNMVLPFVNSNISMVGGNSMPLSSDSFVSKAISCTVRPYTKLRKVVNSLSVGPILAFKKEFIKSVKFPPRIFAEDVYAYLSCVTKGLQYFYSEKAVVYYKLPEKLSDHVSQNIKFMASPVKMRKYFSKEVMEREDYIPLYKLLAYSFMELLKHPVLCVFIYIINLYCKLMAKIKGNQLGSVWKISNSTKIINTN